MGMSISEAIEIINHYLDYPKEEVRKALLLAINTMRKYQKIEEIVNSKTTRLSYELGFRQIKKVIEDGKID